MSSNQGIRINSYLAKSGYGSRRSVELLIEQRRVKINKETVINYSTSVFDGDDVFVDDVLVKPLNKMLYYALNKPSGYVCSNYDPNETLFARDLLNVEEAKYLFHVGRLDRESTGLIIYTNDGDFANLVMHPSNNIEKEYLVETKEYIDINNLKEAIKGLKISKKESLYKIKRFSLITKQRVFITLTEGKNREIRKIFSHFGYNIVSLKRLRIGPILLGDLKEGRYKGITKNQIDALLRGKNK
ncbi:MAG: pseudouridine synthase [Sphaerochaetaceae bacterium]